MEVSQFTYFQQVAGFECSPVPGEITYGLERLAMYVQGVENVYDLNFNGREGEDKVTYGECSCRTSRNSRNIISRPLIPKCCSATSPMPRPSARQLLDRGLVWTAVTPSRSPPTSRSSRPAHNFNLLDARGVISVTERQSYILRIRELAKACGAAWLQTAGRRGRGIIPRRPASCGLFPNTKRIVQPPRSHPSPQGEGEPGGLTRCGPALDLTPSPRRGFGVSRRQQSLLWSDLNHEGHESSLDGCQVGVLRAPIYPRPGLLLVAQSHPPTVSPRRRPGSISRSCHSRKVVQSATERRSHTSRQRHHPKMDPGLRRGDIECSAASALEPKKLIPTPSIIPHNPSHPHATARSRRTVGVGTIGEHGSPGLCVDAKDQPDAGMRCIGTKTCPQARIPDRPTRKGDCLRRAQKIPVRWRDPGFIHTTDYPHTRPRSRHCRRPLNRRLTPRGACLRPLNLSPFSANVAPAWRGMNAPYLEGSMTSGSFSASSSSPSATPSLYNDLVRSGTVARGLVRASTCSSSAAPISSPTSGNGQGLHGP